MAQTSLIAIACCAAAATSIALQSQPAQTREFTYRVEIRIDAVREDLVSFVSFSIGPRGQILLPQSQDKRFLVFDSTGRRVATIGREGDGPGEFRAIGVGNGWKGDSVWAWDARHGRLSFFTANGTYVRSLAPEALAATAGIARVAGQDVGSSGILAAFPDGTFLSRGTVDARAPESVKSRCPNSCKVVIDSFERVRSIRPFELTDSAFIGETIRAANGAISGYGMGIPFAHRALEETSDDGHLTAIITPYGAPRGENSFRVVALRGTGDTVFAARVPYTPVAVPGRAADSAINANLVSSRSSGMMPAGLLRRYETEGRARIPSNHQPYSRMVVARDHSVWIALRATDAGTRWLGLDDAGRVARSLVVPSNIRPVEFDGTTVWAIERDANDLTSALRLRMIPR